MKKYYVILCSSSISGAHYSIILYIIIIVIIIIIIVYIYIYMSRKVGSSDQTVVPWDPVDVQTGREEARCWHGAT